MGKFYSTKVIPLGSCAFRQPYAESHCRLIHGYRLQAKFWFTCDELDKNNWVVDFGGLKDLKRQLENIFDHKTVVWSQDPDLETFRLLESKKMIELVELKQGVGIERFAELCCEMADTHVKEITNFRCRCSKVEVWEHESNSAIFQKYNSI